MGKAGLLVATAVLGLTLTPLHARAWEAGDGPFSFLFHRYGDDMYRPPVSPERPYWHNDAAVPPALRWHDRDIEVVDAYGLTVETRDPEPESLEAGVVIAPPHAVPVRRHVRRVRRAKVMVARRLCPPAVVAAPVPPALVGPLPPVPAPTEH